MTKFEDEILKSCIMGYRRTKSVLYKILKEKYKNQIVEEGDKEMSKLEDELEV